MGYGSFWRLKISFSDRYWFKSFNQLVWITIVLVELICDIANLFASKLLLQQACNGFFIGGDVDGFLIVVNDAAGFGAVGFTDVFF